MLQKGCYSAKIKSAKVYTLEIYPLYSTLSNNACLNILNGAYNSNYIAV